MDMGVQMIRVAVIVADAAGTPMVMGWGQIMIMTMVMVMMMVGRMRMVMRMAATRVGCGMPFVAAVARHTWNLSHGAIPHPVRRGFAPACR